MELGGHPHEQGKPCPLVFNVISFIFEFSATSLLPGNLIELPACPPCVTCALGTLSHFLPGLESVTCPTAGKHLVPVTLYPATQPWMKALRMQLYLMMGT